MKAINIVILLQVSLCLGVQHYQNPYLIHPKTNTPDPGAIYVDGVYYAATTTNFNTDKYKYPIWSSKNLANWTLEGHIFPPGHFPTWAVSDFWAPEIHYVGPHYVAYYAARDRTGMLCVGAAHGKSVLGPWTDIGHPLIRNTTVGQIDPTYFHDEATGKKYIIWKEDGNSIRETYTPIWASEVSDDALSLVGNKVEILKNDPSSWEGPLVEGPWVIKTAGYYYLFYSANGYATDKYALGVARASSVLGPYVKYSGNPFVHSNSHFSGPGHCSVLSVKNDRTNWFLIYHSWIGQQINDPYPRVLMMDSLVWQNGWPTVKDSSPSFTSLPVPQ